MRVIIFAFFIISSFAGIGQNNWIDSVRRLIENGRSDTSTVINYNELAQTFLNINMIDSCLVNASKAYSISNDHSIRRGQIQSLLIQSRLHTKTGNYARAFELALDALKIAEDKEDRKAILVCYERLYQLFETSKNYEEALAYTNKMRNEFKDILPDSVLLFNISLFREDWRPQNFFYLARLGHIFNESNKLDSALKYTQQAYEYSIYRFGAGSGDYPTSFLLGSIQSKMKNYSIALSYLHSSLVNSLIGEDSIIASRVCAELAKIFQHTNKRDSAIIYATRGYAIAAHAEYKRFQLELSELLATLYAGNNNDKAIVYFGIANDLRDTIYAEDRVYALQKNIFSEQMRQREIDAEREKQERQRLENLEYVGIGLGIILFAFLFILLSQSFVVNASIIRFLGIVGLLVSFEFINLLVHPLLGRITHHKPVWMLVFLVILAAVLVPLHHKMEKWVIPRLVERNKKIRLVNAKNVIASLEREKEDTN